MTTLGVEMPALGEMPAAPNEVVTQRAAGHRPGRLAALLRSAATVFGSVVVIVMLVATIGPRVLPYRTFTVLSGSMEPTIPTGSMIFDREVAAADLARGDVVTFHPPGQPEKLVSHRIVRVDETKRGPVLVTRGDANGVVDDWRIPAQGTGLRYEFHVPYLGYVVGGLLTPVGRLVALTLAALWLGGLALWTIWRPRKEPLPARG
ncbi:MAG TPA: signal peptidase I [Actinomycetota bacterium]|nr:signal peptidase I [Actinomycetota bacterium]